MNLIEYRKYLLDKLLLWNVPDHLWEGICSYVIHGHKQGDFLMAVFANDLAGAACRADCLNQFRLKEIVGFVHNEIPEACHGSWERVSEWTGVKLEPATVPPTTTEGVEP